MYLYYMWYIECASVGIQVHLFDTIPTTNMIRQLIYRTILYSPVAAKHYDKINYPSTLIFYL